MRRRIIPYATALAATVLLGLATRAYPTLFPAVIARYGGDTLWAAMMFWVCALLARSSRGPHVAIAALGLAYAVEFSQLYRAPWIDALRASRLGALVLGQGFLWSDLLCYALGVLLALAVDRWLVRVRVGGIDRTLGGS